MWVMQNYLECYLSLEDGKLFVIIWKSVWYEKSGGRDETKQVSTGVNAGWYTTS